MWRKGVLALVGLGGVGGLPALATDAVQPALRPGGCVRGGWVRTGEVSLTGELAHSCVDAPLWSLRCPGRSWELAFPDQLYQRARRLAGKKVTVRGAVEDGLVIVEAIELP
jgi:hypothetical protein